MTINIGQSERTTQNRVVALFCEKLGYRYLGNLQGLANKNIREADLACQAGRFGRARPKCGQIAAKFESSGRRQTAL